MEKSCHKEHTSNIKALSLTVQKLWPMLKFFSNVDQRSRSHDQNVWYQWKGLVTRNTHVKYESSTSYSANVMANVKVFADGLTDPPSGGDTSTTNTTIVNI